MQRYFFELSFGRRRLGDGEGEEFANRADALSYGRLLACEMARSSLPEAPDACVVVLDGRRDELGRIFLLEVAEIGAPRHRGRCAVH